jgi:two-component system NarL family sensor kinase
MKSVQNEYLPLDRAVVAPLPAPIAGGSAAAIRLDPQGRISDATVSAAAMLGFEPQELRGRSLKDLAIEGWQAAAEVAAARVRFGATESFELALKGRSGRRTLVEMTARAGADGKAGAVVAWSERRVRRNTGTADADPDLKRVAYGLLRTQEAERMRVALELHDEVAPIVIMVKYMIEDAVGRLGPEAAAESGPILNDAAARLRDVIAELRRISTDLRPRLLDDLGLLPTLEWFCRVVQEALNNVVEHANARRAQLSLLVAHNELVLMIEDDGAGFDPANAISRRDGGLNLGLQSIRKRVEATGGRLLLESVGQRGTRIGGAWRLDAIDDARNN